MKTYKDAAGKELKVKFRVSGFNDDITCCILYKQTKILPGIKFLGIKPLMFNRQVYQGITTAPLSEVTKWFPSEWDLLANKSMEEYNEKYVLRRIVKDMAHSNSQL